MFWLRNMKINYSFSLQTLTLRHTFFSLSLFSEDFYIFTTDYILSQMNDSSVHLLNKILKQGMEKNHDIQVMLVGQAAVGKTTLTRRLLTLPVTLQEYNSTNGVDVHINSCDIEIDSGKWGKA